MGGPLGLINRRIGDGLVGYRWRAGGSNGLNMPEGYENWNRLQGQPDNGKLKGAISASLHAIFMNRLQEWWTWVVSSRRRARRRTPRPHRGV